MMTNLINLGVALVATGIFSLWMWKYKKDKLRTWMVITMFFASYPYQFGNTIVVSLWGGKNPHGSVASLFPIYIDAKDDALAFSGLGYLTGGRDVVQVFGIGGYLNGGHDAVQLLGIGYQNGGHDAVQVLGIGYQNGGRDAIQLLGIGYQDGGRDAKQLIGMGVQITNEGAAALGFGIPLYQKGATFTGVSWEKASPN